MAPLPFTKVENYLPFTREEAHPVEQIDYDRVLTRVYEYIEGF